MNIYTYSVFQFSLSSSLPSAHHSLSSVIPYMVSEPFMASSTSTVNTITSSSSTANTTSHVSFPHIFATPIHFKIDHDNYLIWKQQVLATIRSLNLASFLEPPVASSSSTDVPSLSPAQAHAYASACVGCVPRICVGFASATAHVYAYVTTHAKSTHVYILGF